MRHFQAFVRASAITVVCVVLFSINALAVSWDAVSETGTEIVRVDRDSIVRNGDIVECWVLWDNAVPESIPYAGEFLSEKHLLEVDCARRTTTEILMIFYKEGEGQGSVVYSVDIKKHQQVAHRVVPGSIGELIWDYCCKKKSLKR